MNWEETTMRSKTSFFNRTLFLGGIKRFWPLWAAYLGIWILGLPLPLLRELQEGGLREIDYLLTVYNTGHMLGLVLGAIFSLFSAMAVWSFLYNARSAGGMACLPVRREGQFFSALLAGFLPLAAGNLIAALLALPVSLGGGFSPLPLLVFFCVTTLTDLFFFGFATLCAQLTGHILALPAVYAVLNFVAVAAEYLLRSVLYRFVYGMDNRYTAEPVTLWLSPPLGLSRGLEATVEYASTAEEFTDFVRYEPVSVYYAGWGILLPYAAAGAVCILLALLLFRRRKMETAGDVVAVSFLRGVFRWCMALGCGLCLSAFLLLILYFGGGSSFGVLLVSFLLGGFIGWFAGEMLLKKTFRVFRGKTWGGFGICCAVILALLLGMRFDLFGFEKRVPAMDRIEFATVYCSGNSAKLSEPESLEKLTALHRAIIADKALNHREIWDGRFGRDIASVDCRILYNLKGSGTLTRYYRLAYDAGDPERIGEAAALQDLLNIPEAIAGRQDFTFTESHYGSSYLYGSVNVTMTAAECARAGGYTDGEEYILCTYQGYSPEEVRSMGPERRRLLALETVTKYELCPDPDRLPQELGDLFVNYGFGLNEREVEALYRSSILPDLEEGALGKVWVLPGREQDEEYAATIELRREYRPDEDSYREKSCTVHPTADAFRTVVWLQSRGIVLHTVEEVNEARILYAR